MSLLDHRETYIYLDPEEPRCEPAPGGCVRANGCGRFRAAFPSSGRKLRDWTADSGWTSAGCGGFIPLEKCSLPPIQPKPKRVHPPFGSATALLLPAFDPTWKAQCLSFLHLNQTHPEGQVMRCAATGRPTVPKPLYCVDQRREVRDREVRLVKTALIACFLAIILGVGFVAGTVWEGWHWQATCKR